MRWVYELPDELIHWSVYAPIEQVYVAVAIATFVLILIVQPNIIRKLFMGATRLNYHNVLEWTDNQIYSRLGELALNRDEMSPRAQQEASKEVDALVFEMTTREVGQ